MVSNAAVIFPDYDEISTNFTTIIIAVITIITIITPTSPMYTLSDVYHGRVDEIDAIWE